MFYLLLLLLFSNAISDGGKAYLLGSDCCVLFPLEFEFVVPILKLDDMFMMPLCGMRQTVSRSEMRLSGEVVN